MPRVYATGAFDDIRLADIRFLHEASKLGELHVALWPDGVVERFTGKPPKFPHAEREYFLRAIRYVHEVSTPQIVASVDALPLKLAPGEKCQWVLPQHDDTPSRRAWATANNVDYRVITASALGPLPPAPSTPLNPPSARKKVVVTGCFDWFHSGHVRFFEECSELGELYVVVGHDANIRLLKGEGHPLFPAVERRYIADSIRFVKLALVSSGSGWMDAEPEFVKIKPDIYAVNEDGDKPEKAEFCRKMGIEYRVLKRTPKEGLPRRESTKLRGF